MSTGREIPLALRAAYLALHRQSEAAFSRYGVSADQFVLLAALAQGEALNQRELARRMSSDPSTVRAMLVLLARRGLVERDAHPTDARARTVALTSKGKQKFRQLWAAGESIRGQMLEALRPGEGELLVRLLARVARSLSPESESISGLPIVHSQRGEV